MKANIVKRFSLRTVSILLRSVKAATREFKRDIMIIDVNG